MTTDVHEPPTTERGFRLRGLEMTRLETFTDAAFAFAATMLVLAIDQIPTNYEQLVDTLRGIPAFLASLAILMLFWRGHERFSRRFGLEDATTIWLTTALIAVVLIYVYPLKFMFVQFFGWMIPALRGPGFGEGIQSAAELSDAFLIYGAGYIALHVVFLLLHAHALRRRETLRLNELEVFDTRASMATYLAYAAVGVLSIGVALLWRDSRLIMYAGFTYASLGFVIPTVVAISERKRTRLFGDPE